MNSNLLGLVVCLVYFVSCQQPVTTGLPTNKGTPDAQASAARYVDAVEQTYERFCISFSGQPSADIRSPNSLSTYFDRLIIEDDAGQPVSFSSLSADQRKIFFRGWKKETAEKMVAAARSSNSASEALGDIVSSLDQALSRKPELSSIEDFYDYFLSLYSQKQELRKIVVGESRGSVASTPTSGNDSDTIHWEGFFKYRNNYVKGNVLVTNTDGSSAGGSPLGHASMMSEPAWRSQWNSSNDNWAIDKHARASISSYLSGGSPNAGNYIDIDGYPASTSIGNLTEFGVSYEQLYRWVTHDSWIKNVMVFKPGYNTWSLFGGTTWHEASDSDRAQAIENAKSYLGKPYNGDSLLSFLDRNTTDKFYCSQIVWRAWYDVDSSKYNFCPHPLVPGIAPTELMQASNLQLAAQYTIDNSRSNYSSAFADVTGDGRADWISSTDDANGSYSDVRRSVGTSILDKVRQSAQFGVRQSFHSVFSDVNGDGKADWISLTDDSQGSYADVRLSNSDGTFRTLQRNIQSGGRAAFHSVFADVNGDGKGDWISLTDDSQGSYADVRLSNGDGTFGAFQRNIQPGGRAAFHSVFADVNGDGKADWISLTDDSQGSYADVRLSNSDGTFRTLQRNIQSGGRAAFHSIFADVNGDGKADWISMTDDSQGSYADVRLSNGDGIFGAFQRNIQPGGRAAFHSVFADVNGDGKADWISLADDSQGSYADVSLSNGTSTFMPMQRNTL